MDLLDTYHTTLSHKKGLNHMAQHSVPRTDQGTSVSMLTINWLARRGLIIPFTTNQSNVRALHPSATRLCTHKSNRYRLARIRRYLRPRRTTGSQNRDVNSTIKIEKTDPYECDYTLRRG